MDYRKYADILAKNKKISTTADGGEYYQYLSAPTTPPVYTPENDDPNDPGSDDVWGTGPALPTAPSSGLMTYDEFLEQYKMPAPQAPLSQGAYNERMGINTDLAYQQMIRQAETDYAKAQATYGQRAEMLGRSGLTGSGYGDYITGQGYGAMQGAKVDAAEVKAAADLQAANLYGQYLANAQAQNMSMQQQYAAAYQEYVAQEKKKVQEIKDVVTGMAANGMSEENILKYIMSYYGIDEETARQYMTGIYDVGASQYAAQTEAETAAQTEAEAAQTADRQAKLNAEVQEMIGGGKTGNVIREQLKTLGYTDAEIDAALGAASSVTRANIGDLINTARAYGDIPTDTDIDDLVKTGTITQEAGNALKQAAQSKRYELLAKKFEAVQTNEEMIALFDEIDRNRSEIGEANYIKLYKARIDSNIAEALGSNDPIGNSLSVLGYLSGIKDTLGEITYYNLVDHVASKISVSNYVFDLWASYITVSVNGKTKNIGVDPRLTKKITKAGKHGDITVMGDNLYVYTEVAGAPSANGWYQINFNSMQSGGKDNALLLKQLLMQKYRKQPTGAHKASEAAGILAGAAAFVGGK